MENTKTLIASTPQINETLESFKQGVDNLLAKRSYFISQVLPLLQEGRDYYVIKGKKSLAKGGAEKLSSIYNLVATFQKDQESLEMLGSSKGLVAFVCTLHCLDVIMGQGRGSDTMERNNNDPNKTLKMAQKRAYVDAVIRTTGLSDIFTQDLEDSEIQEVKDTGNNKYQKWMSDLEECSQNTARDVYPQSDSLITEKQKRLLVSLANQKCDEEEREMLLESIESMDKSEASHLIKELIEQ